MRKKLRNKLTVDKVQLTIGGMNLLSHCQLSIIHSTNTTV